MKICVNMEEPQASVSTAVATQGISSEFALKSTPMPQKYVSMFRIDGVPIISPLMTTEKRRQMQKLKEKAIRVEQRLEDNRRKKLSSRNEYTTVFEEEESAELVTRATNESSCDSSIPETSTEADAHRKEVEKSYLLLSNIIEAHENENKTEAPKQNECIVRRQSAGADITHDDTVPDVRSSDMNLLERIQKLQKSETLIFDNRSSTLVSTKGGDRQLDQQANLDKPDDKHIGLKTDLRDVEEKANLNYLNMQKPMAFSMENTLKDIPSICVDPPTPLAAARTFCEGLNQQISVDAIDANANVKSNKEPYMGEVSSDDSFNCIESATNVERDLKTHRKVTNITSKILKFEHYSVEPVEKDPQKVCNMKPPQRSATSPSLKPLSECSPIRKLEVAQDAQTENGLVRSNSFTLDYPSKALIDHIRQQQVPTQNYPTKRCNILSHSATRDTVESKAKRVQKVESKPRTPPMRLQSKASSTNIINPSQSYPTSNTLLLKSKRSPYDTKQPVNKTKIGRQLKKSVSGTSAIKQVKQRPSMPTIQTVKHTNDHSRLTAASSRHDFREIEAEHRQIFLQLLAHQKAEQQRMQQVFEEQQQQLLEQLSAKMGNVQLQALQTNKIKQRSIENSPISKSECSDMPLRSPTLSMNSSILSPSMCVTSIGVNEMPSLDLSGCTTIPSASLNSGRCTPRRRLFTRENSPAVSANSISMCSTGSNGVPLGGGGGVGAGVVSSNATPNSTAASARRRSVELWQQKTAAENDSVRRAAAVTKINAHVRGYLVRRLFQTEQIQRIVQTIRDTLIFVLTLHVETMQNPIEAKAPENIRLKARLLQQLSSATRTLHLVLFQTTVKERMEIINRDRKRIQTKMLSLNIKRSPRIAT